MDKLSKKLLISLSAVMLTVSCVIGGLFASGNFDSFISAFGRETETGAAEESTDLFIEKSQRPETLRGTRINIKTDLADGLQETAERLIDSIAESGFNSLMFANKNEDYFFNTENIKSVSDTLARSVAYAKSKGLYTAMFVEMPAADGALDLDGIKNIISVIPVDALILSDVYEACKSWRDVSDFAGIFSEFKTYLSDKTSVGELVFECPFEIIKSDDDNSFFKAMSSLMENNAADAVYVEPTPKDADNKETFENCLSDWLEYTKASGGDLIVSQSSSLIKSKAEGFERIENVLSHLAAADKAGDGRPVSTVTCAFTDFSADEQSLDIIKSCIDGSVFPAGYLKTFKISNHNKTSITTSESKISFTGECNQLYPLKCNNEQVDVTEDGDFSIELPLNIGKNVIVFEHRGQKYQYTVTYAIKIIKSISPSGSLKTPGGSVLEIRVTAHKNASVYATLGSSKITLQSSGALISGNEDESMDTNSDYVTFTGKYSLPAGKEKSVSLGNLKAYASYKGISDSATGASVTITADQTIANLSVITYTPPATTTEKPTTATTIKVSETEPLTDEDGSEIQPSEDDTSQTDMMTETPSSETSPPENLPALYTPYKYNGISGTYRMCVVNTDYAETMPLSPLNDLSNPLTTPLLAGTFEFITGESSFDTCTYYNLGSGRRVYRKDVTVIESAYALPANSLTAVGSGTSAGQTYINLHPSWKVPFNVVLKGQKYINDPKNSREYAVTSLGASSLDITFYHTVNANGSINVSGSNVIKSCEWVKDSAGQTTTLRLYLKSASRFYGYSVKYNSSGTLIVSIKEGKGSSVSGHTIMLDPGHGGSDAGAPCAANSSLFNEAKINLQLAERIRSKLQALGATVLMTRTSNTDLTLVQRKAMARKNNPDIFLSIHCDASASSSAYGTTAYYYKPYSYLLAKNIHTNLVSTYKNTIYKQNLATIDRGTVFYPFSVTRIEECPSVLIEYGYVSNVSECKILEDPSHQDSLAAATVNGIAGYFSES